MTTENTTAAARAANKAGKAILDTVAEAGEKVLPAVVETAEVAMALDVPTKVVLNQRLIVVTTAVASAGAGAAILWGVNKFRAARLTRKLEADIASVAKDDTLTPNAE